MRGDFKVEFSSDRNSWHPVQNLSSDKWMRMSYDAGKNWFFECKFGNLNDRVIEIPINDADSIPQNDYAQEFPASLATIPADEVEAMKTAKMSVFAIIGQDGSSFNINVPNFGYRFEPRNGEQYLIVSIEQELPPTTQKIRIIFNYSSSTGISAGQNAVFSTYATISPKNTVDIAEYGAVGILAYTNGVANTDDYEICIKDLHYATKILLKIIPSDEDYNETVFNEDKEITLKLEYGHGLNPATEILTIPRHAESDAELWHEIYFNGRTINGNLYITRIPTADTAKELPCDCYLVDTIAESTM